LDGQRWRTPGQQSFTVSKVTGHFPAIALRKRGGPRWAGCRAQRKTNLGMIFEELNIERFGERRDVLRKLAKIDERHRAMNAAWQSAPAAASLGAWLQKVVKAAIRLSKSLEKRARKEAVTGAAIRLAGLLAEAPQTGLNIVAAATRLNPSILQAELLALDSHQGGAAFEGPMLDLVEEAEKAIHRLPVGPGSDPEVPFRALIADLGELYKRTSGRPAYPSRSHDTQFTYGEKPVPSKHHGKLTGHFMRFLDATFALMGSPHGKRGDEAIAKVIKSVM
jgi:hypothetical protein